MLLGELLIQKKLITQAELEVALAEQKTSHDFLGMILVRRQYLKEEDLVKALSELYHLPVTSLKNEHIDWTLAMSFSPSVIQDNKCLPFRETDHGITVAILNPLDVAGVGQIEEQARNKKINLVLVTTADMQTALKEYQRRVAERIKKMFEG